MRLRSFQNMDGSQIEGRDWQDENTRIVRMEAREASIEDKEIENYLESIDFQMVDRIFREECFKSDSDPGDDAPISRDKIFLLANKDKDLQARYHSLPRIIKLFPEKIRNRAKELGVDLEEWLLFTIFHEITHDYFFTTHKGMKEFLESNLINNILKDMLLFWEKKQEQRVIVMSGYGRRETVKNVSHKDGVGEKMTKQTMLYERFDEGVTDKLALEMMKKYRNYHPEAISAEGLEKLQKGLYAPNETSGHGRAMVIVDQAVADISKASGVSGDVAWEAVKRGKFGKENFNDENTRKILQVELPPETYRKMIR